MIQEFRANGGLVLGVDHGYGNIKTANTIFRNRLIVKDSVPIMTDEYLEYKGNYYAISEGYKNYKSNKVLDDDFYILTIMAIAKELYRRSSKDEKIHLATGLPLKWLSAQKDEFKKYLLRDKELVFTYKNHKYNIELLSCGVMPQGYSAVIDRLREFTGLNMLIDVGNGTINIMTLEDGRGQENQYWTEIMGVKECVLKIREAILDKFHVDLPDSLINKFLINGNVDIDLQYKELMISAAKNYVAEIFSKLSEYGYDEKLMKLHVMGGGAKLIRLFGEYNGSRVFFNHDIHANAKGYEKFYHLALQNNKMQA